VTDHNISAGLRADARRNREQIVAAAHLVFTEQGMETPMEEIARRAGVGVGTLYRRFPDREALIRAVFAENIHHLMSLARAELGQQEDAWDALRRFLRRCVELRLGGLFSVLGRRVVEVLRTDPELMEARQAMLSLLDGMIRKAQDDGAVRPDVGVGDVIFMLGMVIRHGPPIASATADEARIRLLELMLDGLSATDRPPLSGSAFTIERMGLDRQAPP